MERSFGKNHPEYAEVCNSIGILYKVMGKMEEALKIIEIGLRAIEAVRKENKENSKEKEPNERKEGKTTEK